MFVFNQLIFLISITVLYFLFFILSVWDNEIRGARGRITEALEDDIAE